MVLKRHLSDLDPRATMGAILAIAALALTPFAALAPPDGASITTDSIVAIVVLGLLCTAAALVVMAMLVAEVGPGKALVITYVNPIVAVALGVAVLDERPGAGAIAGLLLILAGSWLSTDGRLPPRLMALFRRGRGRGASDRPARGTT
jgi:drug/metabolite transporter (DMT)-like permease